jgi:hypothetical protein
MVDAWYERGTSKGRLGLLACAVATLALAATSAPGLALELDSRLGRWGATGYTEAYGVFRTNRDSQRQRPAGVFDLGLTGDLHPRARFVLDTRLTFGGPPERADGFGIYDLRNTFQDTSPAVEIEDAYLDVFLGPVDLRIGKQKFAWGKLDTIQPTDVLNPERFTDPFVMEEDDTKIGVPAVRASYFLPSLGPRLPSHMSFSLIWIPVPVSTRFPLDDERWFPEATSLADSFFLGPVDFRLDSLSLTRDVEIDNALTIENRRPAWQLDEGAVGARIEGFSGSLDWSLCFYDGAETAPAFDLETSLFWPAARRAARDGSFPPIPGPDEPLRLQANSTLLPRFGRIRLFGGDMAFARAGFTLRAEAAYGTDRVLLRTADALTDPASLARTVGRNQDEIFARVFSGETARVDLGTLTHVSDTVEWGLGIDYLYEGWTPLLQVNQTYVRDYPRVPLLISEVETRLLFVLRKSFFADRLDMELVTMQGLAKGYTMSISRFTYELTDNLRIRFGYLLLAGSRQTIIGQYKDNDEGFVQLRYSY